MAGAVETVKKQKLERKVFLTVVVPIRNRWGSRVHNCLRSIQLQTLKRLEVVVSDYGSSIEGHEKLMASLAPFNCTVYYKKTNEIWSNPVAMNIGIRRARAKHIAVADIDLILEPRVLKSVLKVHRSNPRSHISSHVFMLPRDLGKMKLPQDYSKLRSISRKCKRSAGWGGMISSTRYWWFKVRGFDERLKLWGCADRDLWYRATRDGRKLLRLSDFKYPDTNIHHQYHADSLSIRRNQKALSEELMAYIKTNRNIAREDETIMRNDANWGCFP